MKKRDGAHYLEAVEALSKVYFSREHEAQFLALCPLCAAMYREFVKLDESTMKDLNHALKNSEEPEVPLNLGEAETSIRFWRATGMISKRSFKKWANPPLNRTRADNACAASSTLG